MAGLMQHVDERATHVVFNKFESLATRASTVLYDSKHALLGVVPAVPHAERAEGHTAIGICGEVTLTKLVPQDPA